MYSQKPFIIYIIYNIYNKDNNLIDYSILLFFYPSIVTLSLLHSQKTLKSKVQKCKSAKVLFRLFVTFAGIHYLCTQKKHQEWHK